MLHVESGTSRTLAASLPQPRGLLQPAARAPARERRLLRHNSSVLFRRLQVGQHTSAMIFTVLSRGTAPLSEEFELPEVARESRQAMKAAPAGVLSTTMVFSISAGAFRSPSRARPVLSSWVIGRDSGLAVALVMCDQSCSSVLRAEKGFSQGATEADLFLTPRESLRSQVRTCATLKGSSAETHRACARLLVGGATLNQGRTAKPRSRRASAQCRHPPRQPGGAEGVARGTKCGLPVWRGPRGAPR